MSCSFNYKRKENQSLTQKNLNMKLPSCQCLDPRDTYQKRPGFPTEDARLCPLFFQEAHRALIAMEDSQVDGFALAGQQLAS